MSTRPLLVTRRYVSPDEILELDSTVLADIGSCTLSVRTMVSEYPITVAADLAEVAKLLEW